MEHLALFWLKEGTNESLLSRLTELKVRSVSMAKGASRQSMPMSCFAWFHYSGLGVSDVSL
jgi:hypothetical protein